MNMDNLDPGTLDQNVQEFGQPKRRGWWSRNWLWFVPTLLLGMVLLCCGCPVAIGLWFYGQVFNLEVFQVAMQKIEADETLRRELGEPIKPIHWPPPAFQPEEREIDVRWDIEGPKGRAKAHLKSRLMGQRWETVTLEVVLANGKKVFLAADEGGDESPKWVPPKPGDKKPESNAPAPEINLPTPPADMPGGK